MARIEKVILRNVSRSGAYFRVTDTVPLLGNIHSYYKITGKRGTKTKKEALERFVKSFDKRVEEITLHFRVDYDSKKGHEFFMKDSYASTTVKKGLSDDEAKTVLEEIFEEAFNQELGAGLYDAATREVVEGLERTPGYGKDNVVLKYRHGETGKERQITKKTDAVRGDQTKMTRFFAGLKR